MVKILDTRTLQRLNAAAMRAGRNRTIDWPRLAKQIDPDGVHMVSLHLYHNTTDEIRVQIMIKMRDSLVPQLAFLDMDAKHYRALAEADA